MTSPVPSPTHFDLFGLSRAYDLDSAALERTFRKLSLEHHPDRAPAGDARARRIALERTTAINEGYKVLRDPVRRAFYLLKLHGIDLDREDAGAQKDMPLEFLEEVMTLREELHEAREAKDVAKARAMAGEVARHHADALRAARAALVSLEAAPADAEALKTAAHQLGRVRYFTRFLEEAEAIEEEAL